MAISNALKVGLSTAEATSPTYVFMTTEPVYIEANRPRTLYEEVGRGTSSYSGVYVEQNAISEHTVNAYLTPSLLYRILVETGGVTPNSSTSGENTEYDSSHASASRVTFPSHTLVRDIYLYTTDGTVTSRWKANLTMAKITGETNGMLMVEMTFLLREQETSSITFPATINEVGAEYRSSTQNTTYSVTGGANVPEQENIGAFDIEFSTNIGELKPKLGNVYRPEGGSRSTMLNLTSTQSEKVRALWEDNSPDPLTFTLTIKSNSGATTAITIANTVFNERSIDAPVNEVVSESTGWVSAPNQVSWTLTTPTAKNVIIT